MVANASTVDTILLEGFAITVNKATTGTKEKISLTERLVSVSLYCCVTCVTRLYTTDFCSDFLLLTDVN